MEIKPEKFLPIGSVVTLINGTKKLMIFGRFQKQVPPGKIWDYVACLYPEGNLDEKHNVFFNHFEIDNVFFVGYKDDEEIFTNNLLLQHTNP